VLQGMTGFADQHRVAPARLVGLYGGATIALGYLACFILPNVNAMFERWNVGLETYKNERRWSILDFAWQPSVKWAVATSLALLVAVFINLIAGDSSQFLYFQF
jgi:alginate O-acetyltransferase complex protein AlgI